VKVPGGGPAEARRLSFRALDIEQIGHVYEGEPAGDPGDLKGPEYAILCHPTPAKNTADFRLRPVPPPEGYAEAFEQVVLVERVRESGP